MTKDFYIAAHDELIEKYLEANPGATEEEACEKTADAAWDRMVGFLSDEADRRGRT